MQPDDRQEIPRMGACELKHPLAFLRKIIINIGIIIQFVNEDVSKEKEVIRLDENDSVKKYLHQEYPDYISQISSKV